MDVIGNDAPTEGRIDDLHELLEEALMDDDFSTAARVQSVLGDLTRH